MSIFCRIDDKHIPLYRVMWVSATPHYCGEEDCVREGSYEIRLEQGESVWGSRRGARQDARKPRSLARRDGCAGGRSGAGMVNVRTDSKRNVSKGA